LLRRTSVTTSILAASTAICHCDEQPPQKYRVLVTGFTDWRDMGDIGSRNVWRCRDNPSCRLLLGAPSWAIPLVRDGELPKLLRAECPEAEIDFQVMTTTWGTSSGIDLLAYDVVIHMGLGVYHRDDQIILEEGAFNHRCGMDSVGTKLPEQSMDSCEGQVFRNARMSDIVCTHDGEETSGFEVKVLSARPSNSYICNETHWRALHALHLAEATGGKLKGVFFVHIPRPVRCKFANERHQKAWEKDLADYGTDTDYAQLARGVADVLKFLIQDTVHARATKGSFCAWQHQKEDPNVLVG